MLGLLWLSGCSASHGQPPVESEPLAPKEVLEFRALYGSNCSGCHGVDGRGGAAIALADPVYLAIADDKVVHNAIAEGVNGTSMPAFAEGAGGMLTDKQIDALTSGIRSRWSKPRVLDGANPPSYAAKAAGDAHRGQAAYATYCASCHGEHGAGSSKGSAIANDSLLALMSDQGLRTIVITGRPELGAPDWRSNVLGKPMSDQEVTDVVAWLTSMRTQTPGQPYAASNYAQH